MGKKIFSLSNKMFLHTYIGILGDNSFYRVKLFRVNFKFFLKPVLVLSKESTP